MSGELLARINGHLGRVAVERIRFVQEALPVPADAPAAAGPATSTPEPIAGLPPGALNDALARLGRTVRGGN